MQKAVKRSAGVALAIAAGFLLLAGAFPLRAAAAPAPPEVNAGSYMVVDAATGQVLVSKNADEAKYPASVTKILTLGLTLAAVHDELALLDERVEASPRACAELIPDAASIALTPGEALTLQDLIYATQIESANDAANVLAEFIGGSMEGFADRMNEQAASLGLTGSHFSNPSGQPAEDHYTTARDMAEITRWALTIPGFREVFAATQYQMTPSNTRTGWNFSLKNSILLPGHRNYFEGVTGSKMGYTDAARYTLATTAKRGEVELICVVLDCPTNEAKYDATTQLLNYCFDNFAPAVFPAASFAAAPVPVLGGGEEPLGEITLSGRDVPFLLHSSYTLDDVTVSYQVPESYVIGQDFAPLATLSIASPGDETVLGTIPLTAAGLDEILAANTSIIVQMARDYPVTFWLVAAALAFTILMVVLRIIHQRHRRNKRRAAKLAAARARLPIRIDERPAPSPRRSPGPGTSQGLPALAVAGGAPPPEDPRRPGRVELRGRELRVYESPKGGKLRPFPDAAADPRRIGRAR